MLEIEPTSKTSESNHQLPSTLTCWTDQRPSNSSNTWWWLSRDNNKTKDLNSTTNKDQWDKVKEVNSTKVETSNRDNNQVLQDKCHPNKCHLNHKWDHLLNNHQWWCNQVCMYHQWVVKFHQLPCQYKTSHHTLLLTTKVVLRFQFMSTLPTQPTKTKLENSSMSLLSKSLVMNSHQRSLVCLLTCHSLKSFLTLLITSSSKARSMKLLPSSRVNND